jgi:glyoxylate/hydroxypyruvate reductase A
MPMRAVVAVYHPTLAERYLALLASRFSDLELIPATDEASARAALATADVLLAQIAFPGHLLAQASRLRWIQVMGAGVDAVIPFVPPGVRLSRFTGSLGPRMAEYAIGYILAIAQRAPEVVRNQAAQRWQPLQLGVVRGSTLGVAGLGSVGVAVARLGASIGMRVVGCSRQPAELPEIAEWFPAGAFGAFLGAADFVVLALPATPETRHIVNRETLCRMRPDAWLINVSRGSLIDEAALLDGLRQGQPAGAVLDVFETEPLPPGHPFWEMPNVIVTAHQSGAVIPEEVVDLFQQNLGRYRQGDPLINEVDLGRGY